MSRVGKQIIKIPSGVKVELKANELKVDGPKGKLKHTLPKGIQLKIEQSQISLIPDPKIENSRALQGLNRTLIHNMIQGVSAGFTRELEINGIGYRAQTKGNLLSLTLGFSHPVEYKLPEGIQAKVDANTKVTISGADKILVGMVAAKIRSFKKPDPYQAKGVKYAGERIVRKQGKAAASGGAK